MNNYKKEELLSSTYISRNFGEILNKLKSKILEKVVVIKNNHLEAIILPIDEYERITKKNDKK